MLAVAGTIVKSTASTLAGIEVFSVYVTELIV